MDFTKRLSRCALIKIADSFYLQLAEVGQVIQVQKSSCSTKDRINFTINTGVFIPRCWQALHPDQLQLPEYPTEVQGQICKRIGELRAAGDLWTEINEESDEEAVILVAKTHLNDFIWPLS